MLNRSVGLFIRLTLFLLLVLLIESYTGALAAEPNSSPCMAPTFMVPTNTPDGSTILQHSPTPCGSSEITATPVPTNSQTKYKTLIAKAQQSGSLRVIVELNIPTQPEGLLTASQASTQRNHILSAKNTLLQMLAPFKVGKIATDWTIPSMALRVNGNALQYLATLPQISFIQEDKLNRVSDTDSNAVIGAPSAWASGYDGTGYTIAILDTGVEKTHPFLTGKVVSEACYSDDVAANSLCPGGVPSSTASGSGVACPSTIDGCEHGTHVAGIAAGLGGGATGLLDSDSGVAKGATIIAIQVFSKVTDSTFCGGAAYTPCTAAYDSDIISGLNRVYALRTSYNIAAVNMSLGSSVYGSYCDSSFTSYKNAIVQLRSVNIATVIASGNDGIVNGISSPACISTAISVGSTDDYDNISSFSNSAHMLRLLAPGDWVLSSIPGPDYAYMGGTSMAAPHVTGAWAVMRQKFPTASVADILWMLQSTGQGITDPGNSITRSRIALPDALSVIVPPTVIWVDDALPTGATATGDTDGWTWIDGSPASDAGTKSHQSALVAGAHQHYFTGATSKLQVNTGDKLIASVYLDPVNPPTEVMLQWNDGTNFNHRAYWGANIITYGTDGTASRRYMGTLPPTGQWVRLSVPASQVGLEGTLVSGMAFTLYNGRAYWDRAGKSTTPPATPTPTNTPTQTITPTPTSSFTPSATPTVGTFTVTKLADTNDGICSVNDCSLREAVASVPSGSIINFQPGLTGTIVLGSQIQITKTIAINGPGANVITLSGNNTNRIFYVLTPSISLIVTGLTFVNGSAVTAEQGENGEGGAIYNNGAALTIDYSVFHDNHAYYFGGAVLTVNSTIINHSTFYNNSTNYHGGAVGLDSGTNDDRSILNSTFYNNSAASGMGGAIFISGNGHEKIANSTFTGNSAPEGGAIAGSSDVGNIPVINSTIAANATALRGVRLTNSIVASNTGVSCNPYVSDGGNNLQYPTSDCTATIPVLNPQLGSLQNNGGPTWTMALQLGSAAIDAGNNSVCLSTPINNMDQRGITRPSDGDSNGSAICDIGAFEAILPGSTPTYTYTPGPSPTPSNTPTNTYTPTSTPSSVSVVNKLADTNDGVCSPADCSLREAIAVASSGGLVTFDPFLTGTIQLGSPGPITITRSITITGNDPQTLAVSGGNSWRVFVVDPGLTVSLSKITIRDGDYWSGSGGAIWAGNSNITLTDIVLTNNRLRCGNGPCFGGAIVNSGTMLIDHSAIINNTIETYPIQNADAFGAGIYNQGTLTIANSTISGNTVQSGWTVAYGGAIANNAGGTINIVNSTIANNSASNGGGNIYLTASSGALNFKNSIIANGVAPTAPDIKQMGGSFVSQSYNLITNSSGSTITGDTTGNIIGQDPKLAALANNGGLTPNHALLAGSPAIDAASSSICAASPINNVDQRNIARPFDGDGNGSTICDIGAYEVDLQITPTPSSTFTPTATLTASTTPSSTITASNTSTPTITSTPSNTPSVSSVIWVEDTLPTGAVATAGEDGWNWITSNPTPDSGTKSHQSALLAGTHQHYFTGATNTLPVSTGDTLIVSVFLDPTNPPTEIMLQWYESGTTWNHRAYWGANSIAFGTDGTVSRRYMGALPATNQWVRLTIPAAQVGLEGKTVTGMAFTLFNGRAAWDRAGKNSAPVPTNTPTRTPTSTPTRTPTLTPTFTFTPRPPVIWVEDTLPTGAMATAGEDGWNWITSNPTPDSGTKSHQSALLAGTHQHYFTGATSTLPVSIGDTLIVSVFLDPTNPPTEIMLQWNDGTNFNHRAYWGANSITFGTDGTVSRRYMGALPATNQWVRLTIPAAQVGLEGKTVTGMAFTLFNGRAAWDRAGKQ